MGHDGAAYNGPPHASRDDRLNVRYALAQAARHFLLGLSHPKSAPRGRAHRRPAAAPVRDGQAGALHQDVTRDAVAASPESSARLHPAGPPYAPR